jgi:hypothetical protein
MGDRWNAMREPVSLEEWTDRRVRESADNASRDTRTLSLPYIDEERPAGVDWNFVERREGVQRLDGYVPTENGKADGKVVGDSGVTVASGFDLGQHSPSDLKAMGLYQGLIDRLTPYMKPGLRKDAAQKFLKDNPLSISDEEARMIDRRAQIKSYDDLAGRYNAATRNAYGPAAAARFQDMPQGAQTAIADVAFQYGNLATETPNFWRQVTTGQWQGARDNLMDFKDAYRTRREREAGLLDPNIQSGLLPAPPRTPGR